jgi:hypothetical protein
MARFWGSSSVSSAPAATATAASTKTHGRLVRQMDESNTTSNTNTLTDENLSQHQNPRTPEQKQKAARPLRPRSASRDAGTNATNNSNLTGGSSLFAPEYSSGGGTEDTYDWSETPEYADSQQLDNGSGQPNSSPRRARMNSRDIPRSYSGLYGFSDGDLLPFELNRHRVGTETNTAWFLGVYLTLVLAVQLLSLTVMSDMRHSWTVTNAIHFVFTLIYVHWLKGSLYDEQGEMNALTVWEQLEATQGTKPVRQVLLIVPTVLTYTACLSAQYDTKVVSANIVLWIVAIAAKLPFMNGVRIFGINRTAGIDDNDFYASGGAAAGANASSTTTSNVSQKDKKTL